MLYYILGIVYFAIVLFGCKKENAIENKSLYGRWRLTEVYDEYGSDGPNLWHSVSNEDTHYLEFTEDGQYKKLESSSNQFRQCSGTYQLLHDNKVAVNSSCETEIERMTISELTNDNLIIDRLGTEGVIRYKYKVDK